MGVCLYSLPEVVSLKATLSSQPDNDNESNKSLSGGADSLQYSAPTNSAVGASSLKIANVVS